MCNLVNKSDFYYGTFLAKVLDHGNKPALVNKNNGRGIYKLITDKNDYVVYIKYATNNKNRKRWTFNYTSNNIEEIRKYVAENKNIIFAYVCAHKNLKNSEIAIAELQELRRCINPKCKKNKNNRVTIYKKPNSPVLRMYGTKRADMKDGKDNTIHLERNRINKL